MEVATLIQVDNLSKYYGMTVGVRNLNFHVNRGEVLGFLGPNGAGKTTTMKMLTCYLPLPPEPPRSAAMTYLQNPSRFAGA